MEATWTARLAHSAIAAQAAPSGRPALTPVSSLAAWTSTVPPPGQRTTPTRPTVSRFVASLTTKHGSRVRAETKRA